ncbi:hypothetical protein ZIOFF_029719 [Zingiber officinale]|uniref:Uncharacterized protein n=1 Tax=Zingiber officinale TaxID=94328 RepID=A0A8J5GZ04_ZINOF|nr:hypothetical protein ZIOFF_029719 [Zingiber officinale]
MLLLACAWPRHPFRPDFASTSLSLSLLGHQRQLHRLSSITKLGFALILILSLFLLGLTAEILYLLFRRRSHPNSDDPECAAVSFAGPTPRAILFQALCLKFKHRSRVEPASAVDPSRAKATPAGPEEAEAEAEEEEEEESDLARWRAMCLGPSRALYTIKEEEAEEEEEERGDDEAEETPFATPCASLRFDSPAPSPPLKVAEAGDPPSGPTG